MDHVEPFETERRPPRGGGASATVRLTHPDKVLYQAQGITKRQLADYYMQVSDWILPHVRGRILALVRCPRGTQHECFYQKHASAGLTDHLRTVRVAEKKKEAEYVVVDDLLGLVSLVQMGVLEIHTWGAHADRPERPDQLVFDLDPAANVPWDRVIEAARTVRKRLLNLGLESFLKTTGGKGLHVVVPVQRRTDWDVTKAFCRSVAESISREEPSRYVATMSKSKRKGRVFIDYLRNTRGATSVCAYSTRARPDAPVSTPIAWEELTTDVRADAWTLRNLPKRLTRLGMDPWEGFFEVRQSITQKMCRTLSAE